MYWSIQGCYASDPYAPPAYEVVFMFGAVPFAVSAPDVQLDNPFLERVALMFKFPVEAFRTALQAAGAALDTGGYR